MQRIPCFDMLYQYCIMLSCGFMSLNWSRISSNNAFATWWNSFGCRISCSWLRRTADVAPGSGFLWYKGLLLRLLFRIRHRMTSVFGETGKTWLNCVLHDTSEHSRNRNCSTFKILEMALGTCLVRCQRIIQKTIGCDIMKCGTHAHQNSVHQEGCGHDFNWSQAPLYRPAIEPWMQRSGKLWQFGARNCLLLFAHVFWWTPSGLIWSNFFRLKKLIDNPCFKCLILLPLPLGCMLCCKPSLPPSYSPKSLSLKHQRRVASFTFLIILSCSDLMIPNHVTWKVGRVHFFQLRFQGRIASATWIFSHLGVAGDGIGFLIARGHCQSPAILAWPVTMGSTLCSGDARVKVEVSRISRLENISCELIYVAQIYCMDGSCSNLLAWYQFRPFNDIWFWQCSN